MCHLQLLWVFCILRTCLMMPNREELLVQDPSMWPGHLEPFGSQQQIDNIEELSSWPDPITFFREYVDKSKPVLFKGMAKKSPGFVKFNDDYFKNAPDADKTMIYAEPEKKENRTKQGFTISVKEFIERYHDETLYMVNALPGQYTPDVRMPAPLRCESTRELMSSQVTWFSSGGTKSVLHNDDVDNINCLFRGSKELWMIEYDSNKLFVPIDKVTGGYSSLDVDKVNYTEFPELRKVDKYHKAVMEEGDCFFIPYHWFHQVNSVANDKHMNLAVNIWFRHKIGHFPEGCDTPESEATIDKYVFPDDEEESAGPNILEHFANYIPKKKYISPRVFLKLLRKDPVVNPTSFKLEDLPESFVTIGQEIFNLLDVNQNGKLSKKDFDNLGSLEEKKYGEIEDLLSSHIANLENYFEDLVEDDKKSKIISDSEPLQQSGDSQQPGDSQGGSSTQPDDTKNEL